MGSQTILKFNVIETPLRNKSSTQTNPTFKDTSYSSHPKPKHPTHNPQENDTELSIFDAQKYFSESNETKDIIKTQQQQQQQQQQLPHHDSLSVQRPSSVSSVAGYGRNFRTRSFRATPTASSEASWNSQTGLLSNPPGLIEVSLNSNRSNTRNSAVAKKWFFAIKCCCSSEKSVQVKKVGSELEHNLHTTTNQGHKEKKLQILSKESSISTEIIKKNQNKAIIISQNPSEKKNPHRVSASGRPFIDGPVGFSFPILKPCPNQAIKKGVINIANPIGDSLESFNPGSPNTARDEDMGSDASSDLFEIESFSTPTTSYPMRDSLDDDPRKLAPAINGVGGVGYGRRSPEEPETPSVAATECYPPSEVSIDWSVATAEGFSFSVAAAPEVAVLRKRMEEEAAGVGGGGNKRKGNGLMLMGCREEKAVAVSVGLPQAVKCVAEGHPVFPLHVGGRPPRVANKAAPPGSSHSARLSLAFAA